MNYEPTGGLEMGPAQIGFAGANGAQSVLGGSAGKRLIQGNFNVSVLRQTLDGPANPAEPHLSVNGHFGDGLRINPYGTLMRDEWVQFDRVVMQTARERLAITQMLLSAGLRYELPNALGTMTLDWEMEKGDLVDAEVTMSGLVEATKDRLEFVSTSMPIPIFHKEFFYNLRHLEAARRSGRNIETTHAQVATRKVAELVERTIFTGLTIAGGTIYGLTNHPSRKLLTMTAPGWLTAAGSVIVSDVRRMVDALALSPNFMEGPYTLFVARQYASHFAEDYKVESDDTILQRIEAVDGIARVVFTTKLVAGALLVQMTSDVIEIIDGLPPTLVEWDSHAGFQHNFKLFAIQLPRIRANGDGQTGIAHIS